jgi:hypothetical protein
LRRGRRGLASVRVAVVSLPANSASMMAEL